jgi:uncharacterized protein (DUF1697 family)
MAMPVHVALLYSIVLGPGRRVVMADLRALAAELGFGRPRTLLASGNLVVDAATADPREVEARLEPAFAEAFGRPIEIIVRPAADWPRLIAGNPFPAASEREPSRVAVRVMRAPAAAAVAERLERYRAEGERLAIVDGDIWVHMPNGMGTSRLAAAITPARAGGAGTFRNWNTVRRIGALLEA